MPRSFSWLAVAAVLALGVGVFAWREQKLEAAHERAQAAMAAELRSLRGQVHSLGREVEGSRTTNGPSQVSRVQAANEASPAEPLGEPEEPPSLEEQAAARAEAVRTLN